MEKAIDFLAKAVSRRRFMAGSGSAAAAALIVGCGGGNAPATTATPTPTPTTSTAPMVTDADVLTFALNLEYLEAEFYLHAATGTGLSAADAGTGAGTVMGGSQVNFNGNAALIAYANEIAQDELNHVRFLRAALTAAGVTPVSRPAIDLTFFAGLATAAKIPVTNFTPFDNPDDFLLGAFVFEDVGVTAYSGAAPLIKTGAYLTAAAGILAVEAYHAAEIRTLIVATDSANGNTNLTDIANMISSLRGTLGGGMETALSPSSIVAANTSNAVGFARTTDEVLHIVYGAAPGAGVSKGGFFPNGLNGNITTTAS